MQATNAIRTLGFAVTFLTLILAQAAIAGTPAISGPATIDPYVLNTGPSPARAPIPGDVKTFPGILCRPLLVQDASFIVEPVGIKNMGLTTLNVVCPLVRDTVSNTNGVPSVELNVWNETAGVDFYCVLYNYDKFGLIASLSSAVTSLTGRRTLKFTLYTSVADGYYTLFCQLPVYSKIYSYKLIEELPPTTPETY